LILNSSSTYLFSLSLHTNTAAAISDRLFQSASLNTTSTTLGRLRSSISQIKPSALIHRPCLQQQQALFGPFACELDEKAKVLGHETYIKLARTGQADQAQKEPDEPLRRVSGSCVTEDPAESGQEQPLEHVTQRRVGTLKEDLRAPAEAAGFSVAEVVY